ncbi:MAG: hypothetical protein WBE54_20275, partial [Bradyrhizobium sp.]
DLLGVLFSFAPEAAGASSARHSLRPLISRGMLFTITRARLRRGNVEARTKMIRRHSGARASANPESISPGIAAALWIPGLRLWRIPE